MCPDKEIEELVSIARGFLGERYDASRNLSEEELDWGQSIFISNIFLCSNPLNDFTKESLIKDIENYNSQKNTNISLEELYSKSYIRIILNYVKIPNALWWFCKSLAEKPEIIKK